MATPTQSGRRACGALDSWTRVALMNSAKSPIGRLTKKIHRHDRPLVSAPPSSGPMATATPVMAPKMPNATPRSLPRNASASSASDTENMIAPPTPWTPRDTSRNRWSGANPQSIEAAVNTNRPTA